jgi:predicted regulator of Ras-like GTPase activity (Roadblock/LC7/MglB family)
MMGFANSAAALSDLRQRVGGLAIALLSRDGTIWASEMPVGAYPETFGVMLATVFGAAATANTEVGLAPPNRVLIAGSDSTTIILPVGATELLVAVVAAPVDLGKTLADAAKFAS